MGGSIRSIPAGVCRYRDCVKQGTGKPALCEEHQRKAVETALEPTSFAAPTEAMKMAGSARVARRRS